MQEKCYLCSAKRQEMTHNGNFFYGFYYYFYFSK